MDSKNTKDLINCKKSGGKKIIVDSKASDSKLSTIQACFILHSVGDTIGFRNGLWEFNYNKVDADFNFSNELVFEFIELGAINSIDLSDWNASDDTLMHMATAEGILDVKEYDVDKLGESLAKAYIKSFKNMSGRYPGLWTTKSIKLLQSGMKWNEMPFAMPGTGGGNGGAMRSSCIGLIYHKPDQLDQLIAISIESARVTHNSPIGYLGSVSISYLISCAVNKVHFVLWPFKLRELLESKKIDSYLEKTRGLKEYEREKDFFINMITKYIEGKFTGKSVRTEKSMRNPAYRSKYYQNNFSFPGSSLINPGIGGHDSIIIAYDSFLDAQIPQPSWEKLVIYSCLHMGDSDTTGAIACSLWGAYHGFYGVPTSNYEHLEFKNELMKLGKKVYDTYWN
jgi:ADP-ribosylarginine hydrolase